MMFFRWRDSTRQIEVYRNSAYRWSWRTRSMKNGEITSWWGEDTAEKSNALARAKDEAKDAGRKVVVIDPKE